MKKTFGLGLLSLFIVFGMGFSQENLPVAAVPSGPLENYDIKVLTPVENGEMSGKAVTISGNIKSVKSDIGAIKTVYIAVDKPGDIKAAEGTAIWKITLDGLSDGKHILYVYGESADGRKTPALSVPFYAKPGQADTKAPEVKFTLQGKDIRIPFSGFTVAGTADEGVGVASGVKEVKYSIDGGEWLTAAGVTEWSFPVKDLANGAHNFLVKAIDTTGNEGAPVTLSVLIDVSPEWYRFISIGGMILILGIAYLMSNNRKAIKLQTVVWGTALQFLFAIIVLGAGILSFIGIFIFTYMILFYIFEKDMKNIKMNKFLFAVLILLGAAVIIVGFYFLEKIGTLHIASICLIPIAVFYVISLIAKKGAWARNAFVALLLIGVAVLWARDVSGRPIMQFASDKITAFLSLTWKGTEFLLGSQVVDLMRKNNIYVFLVSVIPTIIFFSAFMSLLYYLGIIQIVIASMGKFMMWNMGTSGAETLSCSANIFVGQTEAPFMIKPFLADMTKSELNAVMIGGFATIAGGVLAAYIGMGVPATHLIAGSVMAAPAALVMAKIIHPETQTSVTAGDAEMPEIKVGDNIIDAVAGGTSDGLKLAVNVAAMLLTFIAILAFVDVLFRWGDKLIDGMILGGALGPDGGYAGIFPMSLKEMFGFIFRPIAFMMGVPWGDSAQVGNMLGLKISVNEFIAYFNLGDHIAANNALMAGTLTSGAMLLSQKAVIISTYAFCGFANFSSIGIQIGGIGALAPNRRGDLASLGLKAMFGGAMASCVNAAIAGILL